MVNERNLDAYSNNLAHLLMCDCCDLRMRSIGFKKGTARHLPGDRVYSGAGVHASLVLGPENV